MLWFSNKNILTCPVCSTRYEVCHLCHTNYHEFCSFGDLDPRCHGYHDNSSFLDDENKPNTAPIKLVEQDGGHHPDLKNTDKDMAK